MRAKPEDEHVAFPGELPVAFDTTGLSQVIPAGKDWLTVALSSAADPLLVRVNVALILPSAIAWDVTSRST